MKTEPLFPEPERWEPILSRMYAVPEYRQRNVKASRWVSIKSAVATITCDECFALQHETGGSGIRAKATMRRTFLGGPKLNLCAPHAQLWKERDAEDCPST